MTKKSVYTETGFIRNLRTYLVNTDQDDIIVRTTHVITGQGWHDDEFDANRAVFNIRRFINPEYTAKYEFAECYRLTRR